MTSCTSYEVTAQQHIGDLERELNLINSRWINEGKGLMGIGALLQAPLLVSYAVPENIPHLLGFMLFAVSVPSTIFGSTSILIGTGTYLKGAYHRYHIKKNMKYWKAHPNESTTEYPLPYI